MGSLTMRNRECANRTGPRGTCRRILAGISGLVPSAFRNVVSARMVVRRGSLSGCAYEDSPSWVIGWDPGKPEVTGPPSGGCGEVVPPHNQESHPVMGHRVRRRQTCRRRHAVRGAQGGRPPHNQTVPPHNQTTLATDASKRRTWRRAASAARPGSRSRIAPSNWRCSSTWEVMSGSRSM